MASAVAVKASALVRIPDVMPYEEAAGFIVAYGTAWHALKHRGELKAGQRLLVLGAAGGVGLAAVELGKALGAHVVAGVSSPEKAQLCRDHGADETLIYPRGPFDRDGLKALAGLFRQAAGSAGFDAILDVVGDAYSEAALRSLGWGGKLLVIGFTAGEIPRIPLNLTLLKSCDIRGVFWGDWTDRDPAGHQAASAELLQLYAAGRLRPFVSAAYPLAEGGAAIAHLAQRKALGKVVVTL
jgi:NADPH2:quinone reductase